MSDAVPSLLAADPRTLQEIERLAEAGEFEKAGELCLLVDDVPRACGFFEKVWLFDRARREAERAGHRLLAYRYALEENDPTVLRRLLYALMDDPSEGEEAMAYALARKRSDHAALLAESRGDFQGAAQFFREENDYFRAGLCMEKLGLARDAGRFYEKHLQTDPEHAEAAYRLGRILTQKGLFEAAIHPLQRARQSDLWGLPSDRLLVACFDALGLEGAADAALQKLIDREPSEAGSKEAFLHRHFGSSEGLRAPTDDGTSLAGRYRIVRTLGEGATARVYLARDAFSDREVAIKVFHLPSGPGGRDAYLRFVREARVSGELDHPNVLTVHEFSADGAFLVMEHMAGGTLSERLRGASLSGPRIKHVLYSVLAGLDAVHRRGVIHRDLKPSNVFFTAGGEVKW
ncbi:MAG: protein kinase, partial [Myxococcales bacterium]|nr:protein kinase [Myxococcales bacterium]